MALCDKCGNFDDEHTDGEPAIRALPDYQPDLYYYWDYPLEEDYDWRCAEPDADCLCEICFDILNTEGKIKWVRQTSLKTVTPLVAFLPAVIYSINS